MVVRVRGKSLVCFWCGLRALSLFWCKPHVENKRWCYGHATYSQPTAKKKCTRFILFFLCDLHPKKECTQPTPKNKDGRRQPFSVLRGPYGHFEPAFLWGRRGGTDFVATWISLPFLGGSPRRHACAATRTCACACACAWFHARTGSPGRFPCSCKCVCLHPASVHAMPPCMSIPMQACVSIPMPVCRPIPQAHVPMPLPIHVYASAHARAATSTLVSVCAWAWAHVPASARASAHVHTHAATRACVDAHSGLGLVFGLRDGGMGGGWGGGV